MKEIFFSLALLDTCGQIENHSRKRIIRYHYNDCLSKKRYVVYLFIFVFVSQQVIFPLHLISHQLLEVTSHYCCSTVKCLSLNYDKAGKQRIHQSRVCLFFVILKARFSFLFYSSVVVRCVRALRMTTNTANIFLPQLRCTKFNLLDVFRFCVCIWQNAKQDL